MEQPIGGGEGGRGLRSPIPHGAELPHILALKRVLRMHLTLSVTLERIFYTLRRLKN